MKKVKKIIASALMLITLASCGNSGPDKSMLYQMGAVIDRGIYDTEITMADYYFEGMTESQINENARMNKYKKCVIHDDGTVTYTASNELYSQILRDYEIKMNELMKKLVHNDSSYNIFETIQWKKDFSSVRLYMDSSEYNEDVRFRIKSVYSICLSYQNMAGIKPDDMDVAVSFIDSKSEDILGESSYKEYIKEQKSSENK